MHVADPALGAPLCRGFCPFRESLYSPGCLQTWRGRVMPTIRSSEASVTKGPKHYTGMGRLVAVAGKRHWYKSTADYGAVLMEGLSVRRPEPSEWMGTQG